MVDSRKSYPSKTRKRRTPFPKKRLCCCYSRINFDGLKFFCNTTSSDGSLVSAYLANDPETSLLLSSDASLSSCDTIAGRTALSVWLFVRNDSALTKINLTGPCMSVSTYSLPLAICAPHLHVAEIVHATPPINIF